MNTTATGRKVLVLVVATLMIALALFAGASAITATVDDMRMRASRLSTPAMVNNNSAWR